MKHEVTSTYTKTALSNALKKLMETKPFSKITVREILYRRYSWDNHRVAKRKIQARQVLGGEIRHGDFQGQPDGAD